MKSVRSKLLTASALVGGLILGPAVAFAQADTPPSQADGGAEAQRLTQLDEIVVTAQRRTENLQNVSISATVLNAGEIARRGVRDVRDLQQVAPSVVLSNASRSIFINIRGVGIAQSAPNSVPGVAVYVDGQIIPHEQLIGSSFFDVGSIEVLRGPQGTLTGQNSTGGAVYMRTAEPVIGDFSGFAQQTIGNYGSFKTTAAINIPLGGMAALRVAAIHEQRDSFTQNIGSSGLEPGNLNLNGARGNLALDLGRLDVNLRGEYWISKSDGLVFKNRNDTISADPYVIEQSGQTFFDQRNARAAIDVRYEVTPDIQAKALVGWQVGSTREQDDLAQNNSAPSGFPGSGVARLFTGFRTFTAEADLLSTGSGPVQWVAGAFWMNDRVPGNVIADFSHTDIVVPSLTVFNFDTINRSKSLFGNVNWRVDDHWELQGGLRYSWDSQRFPLYVFIGSTMASNFQTRSARSQDWTGKVGINYHLDNQAMIYLTGSKGYKAGGLQLLGGDPFKPEKNYVVELGVKTQFLDRHLRLNADVYRSFYKDVQLLSLFNGAPLNQNGSTGNVWGAELELNGQFQNLAFNVGASYLHAQFSDSQCLNNDYNAAGSPRCTGAQQGNDFVPAGATMPFSPRLTFNAGIQYDVDLAPDWTMTPRLQWSHTGLQYSSAFRTNNTILTARDILDARLTFAFQQRYRLELFASNFTNKTYIVAQTNKSAFGAGGIVYGAPRQFGATLTANF